MKSSYIKSRADAVKAARDELERQKLEFCPKCEQRMANQVAAMFCKYLHDRYGFGRKRLIEMLTTIQDTANYINKFKGSSPQDAVEWVEKFIGITLDEIGEME